MSAGQGLSEWVAERLVRRSAPILRHFDRAAPRIAAVAAEMAARFRDGGRLLALGHAAQATDAQHVCIEFTHPVVAGRRALPAHDLSFAISAGVAALARPVDIVLALVGTSAHDEIARAVHDAAARGALPVVLPHLRPAANTAAQETAPDVHQEITKTLYHVLWECVHVFLEREARGQDLGEAGFLYPFLDGSKVDGEGDELPREVEKSIRTKAAEGARLRQEMAASSALAIADAAEELRAAVAGGGKVVAFGNGGSAADANDFVHDCLCPPTPRAPIPAVSLSMEPAALCALANDIGVESIFSRQLEACGAPTDIAVAFSTSGGSPNVLRGLEVARSRGLRSVALLGYDGGEIRRRGLADHCLVVRSESVHRIQEVQTAVSHVLLQALSRAGDDTPR